MTKYTFHSLMTAKFELQERDVRPMPIGDADGDEISEFGISEIVIPKIQRDYAQGRSGDVVTIREDFVQSLYEALSNDGESSRCSLNFIYGQLRKATGRHKVSFVPLDGQQRLTTLFLLHWYLSRLENRAQDLPYLSMFRYDIRYSSSEFSTMFLRDVVDLQLTEDDVKWLAKMNVEASSGGIVPAGFMSRWLQNKPGFSDCWLSDPTISGMLAMLDALHDRFRTSGKAGFLDKLMRSDLESAPIYFFFKHVEPSADDGEMFIKMNSRGKLLTEYEYFKADFQRLMKRANVAETIRNDTADKMDKKWEPSFWRLISWHGEKFSLSSAELDDLMMRYVNYVIDVLGFCGRTRSSNGVLEALVDSKCKEPKKYSRKRLERLLIREDGQIRPGVLTTFLAFLDAWTDDGESDRTYQYFEQTFRLMGEMDSLKIAVFAPQSDVQMLLKVLSGRSDITAEAAVLLFAATLVQIYHVKKETAESRLRSVRNLLCKMDRQEQDMPFVYRQVRRIMVYGVMRQPATPDVGKKTFTVEQVREEIFKIGMQEANSELYRQMRELEESEWFKGSVASLLPMEYDAAPSVTDMAKVFYNRKIGFEKTFGSLGPNETEPCGLLRNLLFWACRQPYCIAARNLWYHWGASSDEFRWRGEDRPLFSRNDSAVRKVLLRILDGKEIADICSADADKKGRPLLEALLSRFRSVSKAEKPVEFDAAYYMSEYYDLFFEPWETKYKDNFGRMRSEDRSLRHVNLYYRKNRSTAYWDPYLYVAWKMSGLTDNVSGILNSGGTEGSRAYLRKQNVAVESGLNAIYVLCSDVQKCLICGTYAGVKVSDQVDEDGLMWVSVPIPQAAGKTGFDSVDRIQMCKDLLIFINSMPECEIKEGDK